MSREEDLCVISDLCQQVRDRDAEIKRLRRMICAQRHGGLAYMDDAEASFGGDGFQRPTDYLRESLDAIEQAWFEAERKRIVAVNNRSAKAQFMQRADRASDAGGGMTITVNDCPFCGYDDVEINEVGHDKIAVCCPDCECIGPIKDEQVDAIKAWNRAGDNAAITGGESAA